MLAGRVSIGLRSDTLAQFRRADNIRRAWFSKGETAGVDFRLTPDKLNSNVRLFTLEIGEQRISYSHGPRIEKPVSWTAGESGRSRLIFEDLGERVSSQQYDGDWSLIHLLDGASLRSAVNPAEKMMTLMVEGYDVRYRLTALTNTNPFDLGLLRNFSCPQSL